jgi:hypothetical protein
MAVATRATSSLDGLQDRRRSLTRDGRSKPEEATTDDMLIRALRELPVRSMCEPQDKHAFTAARAAFVRAFDVVCPGSRDGSAVPGI